MYFCVSNLFIFFMSFQFVCRSRLALCPSCLLHQLTCCCWKDLSLFLKREGRTKSHPLARKASSPLRSGSRRNDVSLIIIVGAETRNPPPDTATGAATDTATTDRTACPASKLPLREGNRVDCNKEVHLTAQISSNQKKGQTPQEKHVCDFRQNALWQSLTLAKFLSSRLHLYVQAPKAIIQQCICTKRCSLRLPCYCAGREAEPWYWAV